MFLSSEPHSVYTFLKALEISYLTRVLPLLYTGIGNDLIAIKGKMLIKIRQKVDQNPTRRKSFLSLTSPVFQTGDAYVIIGIT